MSQGAWLNETLTGLASRRDALRHAAKVPGADHEALLEAALTELDGAVEALAGEQADATGDEGAGNVEALRAERRLLLTMFQQAPVPLFLLEQDGTIRRASARAAEMLGSPSGYATGKALTVFLDLSSRAAVQTQLAAVARTGRTRQAECRVLVPDGSLDATMTAALIHLPAEAPLFIVTIAPAAAAVGKPRSPASSARSREAASGANSADRGIQSMTQRMDMVTAVTRLLLDNSTFSEAVTLQRCARLLAGEIASWVIVDVERDSGLRRQFAAGPRNPQSDALARSVRSIDPEPDSAPWQVHATRKPVLLAHADDPGVLGTGPGGTPLLMLLGATSLICVPISDGTTSYGTLTLARLVGEGHFEVADLALAQDLGHHLALAIRVDRMFRRRSEVAETLQASLLPTRLPAVAGFEFAAAYIGATQWQEISGDFYDVFRSRNGWAIAIGDVCGKGQDAAAMTAAARHAIRAFAHHDTDPTEVLVKANEILLAGDYDERFVTAKLAFMRQLGRRVRVRLGSAGHPGPAVVRADGRVEILEGDGLPLGLFGDAKPDRADLDLGDGDLLFFYTDGVTDARGTDLTFFEDQLADELAALAGRSAAETVRAVQELVTAFCEGELRDDVTILAVKVGRAS
jgi:serine phosphatase RsbU (regulator of sigma subunit)/PAS domain-containing protein